MAISTRAKVVACALTAAAICMAQAGQVGATTLTLQRSIDGSTFSGDVKNQQVLAGASDFCFEGFSSAGFLRLLSSANVTVTATGAGAA